MKFLSVRFRDEIIERENSKVFINDDLCRCTRFLLNLLSKRNSIEGWKNSSNFGLEIGEIYIAEQTEMSWSFITEHGELLILSLSFPTKYEECFCYASFQKIETMTNLIHHRTTWIFFQSLERFEKKECSIFYLRSYQPQREFSKVSIFRFSFLAIQFPFPKLPPSIN